MRPFPWHPLCILGSIGRSSNARENRAIPPSSLSSPHFPLSFCLFFFSPSMLHPTGFYATYANEFGMTVPPSAVSSAVSNLYIDNSRLTRRGGGLYATDAAVMESISLSSSSVDASLVFTDVSRSNAAVPAAAANDAANNLEREDRLDDGAQDGAWPSPLAWLPLLLPLRPE